MDRERFRRYRHVFWDFDGVVKESVTIKEDAYCELFLPYGPAVAARVREHHLEHGGMSRFDKIPHYFREFAGVIPDAAQIDAALAKFESLVYKKVIDCPWVPGARELILGNPWRQTFYLVTATPKQEIDRILGELGLFQAFARVAGAPEEKADAIASAIGAGALAPHACVMIGDSRTDHAAALANGIDFVLRDTPENAIMQRSISLDFRVKDLATLAGPDHPQTLPARS